MNNLMELEKAELEKTELEKAELEKAELEKAELEKAELIKSLFFPGHFSVLSCGILAGDMLPSFINNWWIQAYPIIEQIAATTGAITGVAAIATATCTFIKWAHFKLRRKYGINEYTWIELILNKEEWSASTLAQKLDLTEDETKKMLKGFGYTWNPHKMLYVSSDITKRLRNIRV